MLIKAVNFSNVETRIVIHEVSDADEECRSPLLSMPSSSLWSIGHDKDDGQLTPNRDETLSQMSFIMKEKLHELARDLRRRTSSIRDEITREPTPEADDNGMGEKAKEQVPTDLMSLLGLDNVRKKL